MSIFKKRKKEEDVDVRTDLEKSFEETGQKVGKSTGEFVQKGIDKMNELKDKFETDDKFEKARDIKDKSVKAVDEFVGKAKVKVEEVVEKVKKK